MIFAVSWKDSKATAGEEFWSVSTVTILFFPTDPPKKPTLTVFEETQGGLQGILDCRVDSEPPASLTLHLGSQLVASNQPQGVPTKAHVHFASPNALRLDIEELGASTQGEYVCTASNILGSASASASFGTRGEENGTTSRWITLHKILTSCSDFCH